MGALRGNGMVPKAPPGVFRFCLTPDRTFLAGFGLVPETPLGGFEPGASGSALIHWAALQAISHTCSDRGPPPLEGKPREAGPSPGLCRTTASGFGVGSRAEQRAEREQSREQSREESRGWSRAESRPNTGRAKEQRKRANHLH